MTTTINASTAAGGGLIQSADASGILALQTANTTALTIDNSQNVGIGTTPSAWTTYKAVQIGSTGSLSSGANFNILSNNWYYDGTDRYLTTGQAVSQYYQNAGAHIWRTASSGTAGNAISFSESMRIDSSGNVGIGTSSPSNKLSFGANIGSYFALYEGAGGASMYGIGTESGALTFKAAGIERMRIDSSGNLLVGGTTVYGSLSNSLQLQNGNNIQIVYRNTGTTAGRYFRSGMDSGSSFTVYNDASTGVYLAYGATSWTANSDERLKTALTPFENAASKVCSLRAGTGRYLTDNESVSRSFLIAQDVQKVLPQAVHVQEDEQGTLGLQYTDLIPLLTAAIQEQQAIITQQAEAITQLQADVTALKA